MLRLLKAGLLVLAVLAPRAIEAQAPPEALRTWCFSSATEFCFSLLEFDFIVSAGGTVDEVWDINIAGTWYGSGFPLPADTWMGLIFPIQTTTQTVYWWFPGRDNPLPAQGGVVARQVTTPSFARGWGNAVGQPHLTDIALLKLGEWSGERCLPNPNNPSLHQYQYQDCFTVTPEPSTYILLATGLGVLGIAARRRQKRTETEEV